MAGHGTVTDLGDFYRKQGAERERARIVEWLGTIDVELGKQADASESDDERNTLVGAHELIVTMTRELTKP